jgi:excisionase family DNA binding protein
LTPAHVARRFSVSERTIRYWAEVGELPGFKIGPGNKLWRFDARAIEDYLKGRESASLPEGQYEVK